MIVCSVSVALEFGLKACFVGDFGVEFCEVVHELLVARIFAMILGERRWAAHW